MLSAMSSLVKWLKKKQPSPATSTIAEFLLVITGMPIFWASKIGNPNPSYSDALNIKAVEKIYKIKGRKAQKACIILVDSLEMLANYVDGIPAKAFIGAINFL